MDADVLMSSTHIVLYATSGDRTGADEQTSSVALIFVACVIHLAIKMKYQNTKRNDYAKMVSLEMREKNARNSSFKKQSREAGRTSQEF